MNNKIIRNLVVASVVGSIAPLCLLSQPAFAVEINKPSTRPVIERSNEPTTVDNNSTIRSIRNSLPASGSIVSTSIASSSVKTKSKKVESVELESIRGERIIYIKTKAEILEKKMIQAEFTVMALNNMTFIKQALEIIKEQSVPDVYTQCVFDNLDRDNYLSELKGVAQYLVDNYPNDVDAYIEKLDFLIPIVQQIYNHPDTVEFNSDKFSKSSALMILTEANAEELERTVNDERYMPLLATIGLPTKRADGKIEDISIMQVDSIMEYVRAADNKCGGKTKPVDVLQMDLNDLIHR